MTTVEQPGRFATLPDEETLAATVVALEEHGFSVDAGQPDFALGSVHAVTRDGTLVVSRRLERRGDTPQRRAAVCATDGREHGRDPLEPRRDGPRTPPRSPS
jgi:hypothetical protein